MVRDYKFIRLFSFFFLFYASLLLLLYIGLLTKSKAVMVDHPKGSYSFSGYEKIFKSGFIGIEVMAIPKSCKDGLKCDSKYQFSVNHVFPGSPAEKQGISTGNTILAINNMPVDNPDNIIDAINYLSPGEKVSLLIRDNKKVFSRVIKASHWTIFPTDRHKKMKFQSTRLDL